MKFTQIAPVRFKTQVPGSFREGFTLFALGEDGQVYKSIPQAGSSDHKGWVCLAETILPGVNYPPPRRESRRYLGKGEKVLVFDSRFGDSSPMAGVIVGVLFDGLGGFSGYEVAWPADAPDERQVFSDRQVEKYRESALPAVVPAPSIVEQAVAAMAPSQDRQHEMPALVKCGKCGQGRSRGHYSKALYCTVGGSTFTAVPDEPCPQGCPHPLSEHSSAGCMTFCPCSWKVAENGEDEAVTKSATVGDINPAELLPDLPGKQALVELCDSTVQAEEQSAILKPEDYPF